jgi:hypothetical protein
MKRIAKDLNLQIFSDFAFFKRCPRIGNLFGGHTLFGKLRGKDFTIYATKFPNCAYFPLRLVVRAEIHSPQESLEITIRGKPFLHSLQRIFNDGIFVSGNRMLDSRLLFSTNNREMLEKILFYEEICDQLYEIWGEKRRSGTLEVNGKFAVYHEPFRWITDATRTRVKNVAHLIGDVADVMALWGGVSRNVLPGEE